MSNFNEIRIGGLPGNSLILRHQTADYTHHTLAETRHNHLTDERCAKVEHYAQNRELQLKSESDIAAQKYGSEITRLRK